MEDFEISGIFPSNIEKKPMVYIFTNDVLAGVVHYYRKGKQPYQIVAEMTTNKSLGSKKEHNLDCVTEEDMRYANEIRSYYTKKIFLQKLKGEQRISKFKKEMQEILSRDERNQVTLEEFKILVKLPWFYRNDKDMDQLLETYNCDIENYSRWEEITQETTLRLIRTFYIHHRRMKIVRIMFELEDTGRLVAINIKADNTLLRFFTHMVERESLTIVSGNMTINCIPGSDKTYYTLDNWRC